MVAVGDSHWDIFLYECWGTLDQLWHLNVHTLKKKKTGSIVNISLRFQVHSGNIHSIFFCFDEVRMYDTAGILNSSNSGLSYCQLNNLILYKTKRLHLLK